MYPAAPDEWFNQAIKSGGGIFDRASYEMCLRHVSNFRVAIDAGAHVGSWTHALADKFDKVYAFEPNPKNLEFLKKNLEGRDNVQIREFALGADIGFVGVRDGHENSGQSHVIPGEKIPLRTLDSSLVYEDSRMVDLLKIDTEGFELFVLQGAGKTIEESRPAIMVELNGLGTRYGVPDREVQQYLESLGYRLKEVCNKDYLYTGK